MGNKRYRMAFTYGKNDLKKYYYNVYLCFKKSVMSCLKFTLLYIIIRNVVYKHYVCTL